MYGVFKMKLCTNQSIPCEYLKGACIFLSDEDEGRYIKDVCVDLEKHSIILIDDDGNGLYGSLYAMRLSNSRRVDR